MARMRSVKPEFWDDQELAEATCRDARLLYIGLWNIADEHSRLRGDARFIKGEVFTYDDDLGPADVDRLLDELVDAGKVVRYVVGKATYLYLPNLARHQRLDTDKVPSRLPAPPGSAEFESRTDESGKFPDEYGSGDDSSALKQVAGSREHAAGSGGAKFPDDVLRVVTDATDATTDEAVLVAERVEREKQPRSLPAMLRTLAKDGDLKRYLDDVRKAKAKTEASAQLVRARASPPCAHGQPGGNLPHPTSGEPICAQCRHAARRPAA